MLYFIISQRSLSSVNESLTNQEIDLHQKLPSCHIEAESLTEPAVIDWLLPYRLKLTTSIKYPNCSFCLQRLTAKKKKNIKKKQNQISIRYFHDWLSWDYKQQEALSFLIALIISQLFWAGISWAGTYYTTGLLQGSVAPLPLTETHPPNHPAIPCSGHPARRKPEGWKVKAPQRRCAVAVRVCICNPRAWRQVECIIIREASCNAQSPPTPLLPGGGLASVIAVALVPTTQQRLRDFPHSPTEFAFFFTRSAPPRGDQTPLRLHFPLKIGVTVTFPPARAWFTPRYVRGQGGGGGLHSYFSDPSPPDVWILRVHVFSE